MKKKLGLLTAAFVLFAAAPAMAADADENARGDAPYRYEDGDRYYGHHHGHRRGRRDYSDHCPCWRDGEISSAQQSA